MSRTDFAKSQSHLRNRSSASTARFGYQSLVQVQSSSNPAPAPFVEEKQSTPYDVSDEDRSKFRSFKFPRSTSISAGGSVEATLPSPSPSPRSFISCDTPSSSSNAVNLQQHHGLPTPPPSASNLFNIPLKSPSLTRSPLPLSLPQRFKKQYQHMDDSYSYSTSKNASVDLRNMEETFIEDDSFGLDRDGDRSSMDATLDGPGWYAYRWPSQSHSQCEPSPLTPYSPFASDTKNPGMTSHYSPAASNVNTFRIKRGVVFRTGLPSTTVIRMLLWGSWLAMAVLVALAVLFVFRV